MPKFTEAAQLGAFILSSFTFFRDMLAAYSWTTDPKAIFVKAKSFTHNLVCGHLFRYPEIRTIKKCQKTGEISPVA